VLLRLALNQGPAPTYAALGSELGHVTLIWIHRLAGLKAVAAASVSGIADRGVRGLVVALAHRALRWVAYSVADLTGRCRLAREIDLSRDPQLQGWFINCRTALSSL